MTCVSAIAPGFRFVSGADEKVLRVFEAPSQFFDACENLGGVYVNEDVKSSVVGGGGYYTSGENVFVCFWLLS